MAEEPRNYLELADSYREDVLSGRQIACTWVRFACDRQRRDLHRSQSDPRWPYVWSGEEAVKACAFIERLPHVEGRWETPTIRLEPWQAFIVATVFGWRKRGEERLRRFSEGYFEVARKAAKTTLSAAMGLYHLAEEREPGAQVKCGATTGQQARIVFGIMQQMVERSAWLRELGLTVFANSITFEDIAGNAQPINAKASTQDGLNPSWVILDEGHALPDHKLRNVLKSAMGSRENPFTWLPTTAGYNLLGPAYEQRSFVAKMLEGIFEADEVFGIIFTLDEADDWRDETVWPKANPMLGITPKVQWMRQYCEQAKKSPGLEGEFRTKCCNQWLTSASRWLSTTEWDACGDPSLALESFAGERCWIGADLAQLDDLAAVALAFQREGITHAFVRFYLPHDVVAERAQKVPAYRQWERAGLLILTDGNMIDYARIERDIREWCTQFNVVAIRFDQFGSVGITGNLFNDGFPAAVIPKNAKTMTTPARELETRVRHGLFRHDGNSCLKWNASNCVVRRGVDDSLLPKKESAESPNKIDGIDALLQAMSEMPMATRAASAYDSPQEMWL